MGGFSFRDIPSVSRVSPVARQSSDGIHRFADRQERGRQHDDQMEFSRDEAQRQADQFAKRFGLDERRYDDSEDRKSRLEEAEAWEALRQARDRDDENAIRAAQTRLKGLGFSINVDSGETTQNEGPAARATEEAAAENPQGPMGLLAAIQANDAAGKDVTQEPAPQAPPAQNQAQMMPGFMQTALGQSGQQPQASPSVMQQGMALQRQGGSPLPSFLQQNPIAALYQAQAKMQQTDDTVEAAKEDEMPEGAAPDIPAEKTKLSSVDMEPSVSSGRTVIRDQSGNVVDSWSAEQQAAHQEKKRARFIDAKRAQTGIAKKAMDMARELHPSGNKPAYQTEKDVIDSFWKFYGSLMHEERAKMAASRPRGGGRAPVNDYNSGRDDVRSSRAGSALAKLGDTYQLVKDSIKGLNTDNPILSSGAVVSLAKAYHQGDRLTDQDIRLMNVSPGVWEKVKNATSLELAQNLSEETRLRMGEALVKMRSQMAHRAARTYKSLVSEYKIARGAAKPGYSNGMQAGLQSITANFPGLYNPKDFGMGGGEESKSEASRESSSKKMKALGL